jgi:hypothetical protein
MPGIDLAGKSPTSTTLNPLWVLRFLVRHKPMETSIQAAPNAQPPPISGAGTSSTHRHALSLSHLL